MKSLSRVRLFATPWTVACQAPPSMEFSRQEYWSGLPLPSPGNLPNPGTEPGYSMIYIHLCIYHPMKLFQSKYGIFLSLPKVPSCLFIIHIHPDASNCCSLFCHYGFLLKGHIKGIMKYIFVGVWLLSFSLFFKSTECALYLRNICLPSLWRCFSMFRCKFF